LLALEAAVLATDATSWIELRVNVLSAAYASLD